MYQEEWRDIKGYEGLYQVSNLGRVKSLERTVASKNGSKRTVRERIRKQSTDKDGYLQLTSTMAMVKLKDSLFIALFVKHSTRILRISLV